MKDVFHTRRSLRKTSITEGSWAEGKRARPPAPRSSPPSPGLRGRAQPRAFSRSLGTCPEATRPASTCPHLPSGSSPTSNAGPLLWGPSLPAEAGPNRSVPGGQACGHRLRTVPCLPHPWARSFVWRLRAGSFGGTGRPFSTVTVTAPPPSRCQPLLADGTATHGRSGGRTGDHTARLLRRIHSSPSFTAPQLSSDPTNSSNAHRRPNCPADGPAGPTRQPRLLSAQGWHYVNSDVLLRERHPHSEHVWASGPICEQGNAGPGRIRIHSGSTCQRGGHTEAVNFRSPNGAEVPRRPGAQRRTGSRSPPPPSPHGQDPAGPKGQTEANLPPQPAGRPPGSPACSGHLPGHCRESEAGQAGTATLQDL